MFNRLKKLECRELEGFVQGHAVHKWQSPSPVEFETRVFNINKSVIQIQGECAWDHISPQNITNLARDRKGG